MGCHRLREVGFEDALTVIGDIHAGIHKVRVVERLEGVELLGALLRGAVAAQQVSVDIDSYFGYQGVTILITGGSNLYRRDEVLLTVGA